MGGQVSVLRHSSPMRSIRLPILVEKSIAFHGPGNPADPCASDLRAANHLDLVRACQEDRGTDSGQGVGGGLETTRSKISACSGEQSSLLPTPAQ